MTQPRIPAVPLRLAAASVLYLLAVVGANVLTDRFGLVPVLPGFLVTAGTYAAGFALLLRDVVQQAALTGWTRTRSLAYVVGLILTAGALSWWTAAPGIAVASTVAFLAAEVVDLTVFTPLREAHGFTAAALVSNIVSAPVDTILFLWVTGFPLTEAAVIGQWVGKVLWATAVPLAVWALIRRLRAVPR